MATHFRRIWSLIKRFIGVVDIALPTNQRAVLVRERNKRRTVFIQSSFRNQITITSPPNEQFIARAYQPSMTTNEQTPIYVNEINKHVATFGCLFFLLLLLLFFLHFDHFCSPHLKYQQFSPHINRNFRILFPN